MGAPFLDPAPVCGMEISCRAQCPDHLCSGSCCNGSMPREASLKYLRLLPPPPPLLPSFQSGGVTHREACHCSHPQLQNSDSKFLLRGLERVRHAIKKAPDLFPKELRSSNLSGRRFMDLMKIQPTIKVAQFTGNKTAGRSLLGSEQVSNKDLRNYSFKEATI